MLALSFDFFICPFIHFLSSHKVLLPPANSDDDEAFLAKLLRSQTSLTEQLVNGRSLERENTSWMIIKVFMALWRALRLQSSQKKGKSIVLSCFDTTLTMCYN